MKLCTFRELDEIKRCIFFASKHHRLASNELVVFDFFIKIFRYSVTTREGNIMRKKNRERSYKKKKNTKIFHARMQRGRISRACEIFSKQHLLVPTL